MNKENENINNESLEVWEIAEKISQQIPDEEWQKFPTDLSNNLDNYLSGGDKILRMKKVFADTGYWIALLNPYDDLHNQAKKLSQSLKPVTIVTTQMVLAELLNEFSKRGKRCVQPACLWHRPYRRSSEFATRTLPSPKY